MKTVHAIHAAHIRDDPEYRAAYEALAPEFERAADIIDKRMELERAVVKAAIEWYYGPLAECGALYTAIVSLIAFDKSTNANAQAVQGQGVDFHTHG